ncbi:hypothetical protein JOB18_002650 [Solea senegalensis]|uniref:Mitochondrial assembly of ribosomal large subunit protein 1 n=1 Tax=Solea senegalensis TaxID=28829 RepID=A0AAV6PS09_SOLSE|nr:mitochondrial assembly of ribosomal large subunit protein 1 [Solea senegalensis]KAG7474145.1 hypothetical protein JOB18_002650 [Solea senegalensis]
MSVFNSCKKVVSTVFKGSVSRRNTGVFRGVCSINRHQCHNLRLPRHLTLTSASCLQRPHVFTCHVDSRRFYSEVFGERQEESPETDSHSTSHCQKPSNSFTLDVLVSLLRQENAVDMCVIKVPDQIKYAEYFIVVSGVSPRHLRAMALYAIKVYKFLKKDGDPNVRIEGKEADDWMCIDFGKIVVHFMLPETRDEYELEKLWTLRNYDEQLRSIPAEKLPEDFIYDVDVTK